MRATHDRQPDPAEQLASEIGALNAGETHQTQLTVDDRVLARITDGIYRRPSAALRELIFNAYDADATEVVIDMDVPRFERISVRDNGIGMNERSLANLVKHIGGSSKRTYMGMSLGTVSPDDPERSPGGRRLIGKIGIGLFAVSHLTTHFRVITKQAGARRRLMAEVFLKTWTEENLRRPPQSGEDDEKLSQKEFITGDVIFSSEYASDAEVQGTEVILLNIRNQTRDSLRSAEFWQMIEQFEKEPHDGPSRRGPSEPAYHIGYAQVDAGQNCVYLRASKLPWKPEDDPLERFQKLYDGVVEATMSRRKNPDIEEFLDSYLATIWRLSLAAPLDYLKKHPFDLNSEDGINCYHLTDLTVKARRQQVVPFLPDQTSSVAQQLGLLSARSDPVGGFSVIIDNIQLRRPVVLSGRLGGGRRNTRADSPMMFVGSCQSSLEKIAADVGGGALEFDAYFYWNSLIVPKQNRGILIRINGASGVLYDDRFMDYQISELNRLTQITSEVFIVKGLDPALNIDRESFNVSHPHYQYLAKWVHAALRQITNFLKELSKKGREKELSKARERALSHIENHLIHVWDREGDSLSPQPDIQVLPAEDASQSDADARRDTALVYRIPQAQIVRASSNDAAQRLAPLDQAKSIFVILAAYGLLEDMPYDRQQSMFKDILETLAGGEEQQA